MGIVRRDAERRGKHGRGVGGSRGDPVTIDVDRKHAGTITWEDGHVSRFPLEVLRANCTCPNAVGYATRADRPGRMSVVGALQVESASKVGNWGLNIHWNDGHTAGIFTWEVLRASCLCERCAGN